VKLKKYIQNISLPVHTDSDPARMKNLKRMTRLFLLAWSALFVLIEFAAWLCGFIPVNALLILLALSVIFLAGISLFVRFLIKQFKNALEKARQEPDEKKSMQPLQAQNTETTGALPRKLAHDFNNILGGIMGSLSLLDILLSKENIQQKEKIDRAIKMAMDASRRGADMVK
jgi:fatty acid desaturase